MCVSVFTHTPMNFYTWLFGVNHVTSEASASRGSATILVPGCQCTQWVMFCVKPHDLQSWLYIKHEHNKELTFLFFFFFLLLLYKPFSYRLPQSTCHAFHHSAGFWRQHHLRDKETPLSPAGNSFILLSNVLFCYEMHWKLFFIVKNYCNINSTGWITVST